MAYVENLALLRHWKENVRIFFYDSDEYLIFRDHFTPNQMLTNIDGTIGLTSDMAVALDPRNADVASQVHALGVDRFMAFCVDCPRDKPELRYLSLTTYKFSIYEPKLMHPKLVVNPNKVGCYIVHWAGCGAETKMVPISDAYIIHFENIYTPRWNLTRNELLLKPAFNITKSASICDPGKFDWKVANSNAVHIPVYE